MPTVARKSMEINKVYVDKALKNQSRFLVLMGGAGSGKSVFAAQKILIRLKSELGHRILVVRKVGSTIGESVFALFKDLIDQYDLHHEFTVLKSEYRIIHKSGNEILFKGMDEPEKIKSVQGITSMWLEECTELEKEDFYQLNLRLRGEMENYKQIILSFNPIREDHWLKAEFFDKEEPDTTILVTTYRDNAFLDREYVKQLEEKYKSDENLYLVYSLGKWGRLLVGAAFYKRFNYSKHVKELQYNEDLPIGLSFDFNLNPYSACLVAQVEGRTIRFIDEICPVHPNNTLRDDCLIFKKRYPKHKSGLNIYGDCSGKQGETTAEKGYNSYTLITNELQDYKPALRVPSKNPNIIPRGQFINNVFDGLRPVTIEIDPKCKNLINDLTYTVESETGEKQKNMFKDKVTLTSYQKYGHCSDAFDYIVCYIFSSDFEHYQRGGKKAPIIVGKKPLSKNSY